MPYQAQLVIYTSDANYLCSGTIITSSIIATAAHCLTDNNLSSNGPVFRTGLSVGVTVGKTTLNYWPKIKVLNDDEYYMYKE